MALQAKIFTFPIGHRCHCSRNELDQQREELVDDGVALEQLLKVMITHSIRLLASSPGFALDIILSLQARLIELIIAESPFSATVRREEEARVVDARCDRLIRET